MSKIYKSSKSIGKIINLFLCTSLILSCCKPVNVIKPQDAIESPPLSTQESEVSQPNVIYEPPVFVQPEPRIADDIDSLVNPTGNSENQNELSVDQLLEKQDEIKTESKTNFLAIKTEMEEAIAKIKKQYQSFTIVPNPQRKITPKNEPCAELDHNSITIDHGLASPIASGKRMGAPVSQEQANTFNVTNLSDLDDGVCDSDCSLREAIYAANDSTGEDSIIFNVSGVVNLEDTLPYILDTAGLTIDGSNQSLTINGPESGQIFFVNAEVTLNLSNLNFSKGFIYNEGILNIQNVTGINYMPGNGTIGISNCDYTNQSFYIENSIIYTSCIFNNSTVFSTGSVTAIDSSFANASYIYSTGPFISQNSTHSDSQIYSDSSINITGGDITDNTIYGNGNLYITDTPLSFSGDGGFHSQAQTTLTDITFSSQGRANIYSVGNLEINDSSIITGGTSWWGSSIYSEGTISMSVSEITYNEGGSIFSEDFITAADSMYTSSSGGYLHSLGSMSLSRSTFHLQGSGFIRSVEDANIDACVFNETRIQSPGTFFVTGITIIDKGEYGGEDGGNLIIDNNASVQIANSNLYDCNEITNNGSFQSINNTFVRCGVTNASIFALHNSILADNSHCHGSITDGNNNLFELSGNNACNVHNGQNNNYVGSLANFTDYSNSILSTSSPAIDRGDPAICAAYPVNNTSQNGVTRPQGSGCDIGSYEAPPASPIDDKVTVSDCLFDNCIATGDATNNKAGEPINTRTGAYQYNVSDISIPTSVGELTFSRNYASLGIPISSPLSPGWTHNQDTRLIMPGDSDGVEGVILLKLHTSNLYTFTDNGDGTYTSAPGLLVNLIRQDGPPILYTITDSDQNTYKFNEAGKLLTYINSQGNAWEYSYNSVGLLSQINDGSSANSLSLEYNNLDQLISVTDQTGRDVTYSYDGNGNLITFVDILGQTWTYAYDSAHRLTIVLDPEGLSLERNEYDEQGRVVRQYDGNDDLIVALTYNADGTTTITDAVGNSNTNSYDLRGTMTRDIDASGGTRDKSYLSNFRPFRVTNANGNITDLSWSNDGINLKRIVDTEENQINIAYDSNNNPTSIVDPLNYLTTYEYNGKLLTNMTNALNQVTTFTYTTEGFLASETDPLGNTTSFTYNSLGQRTSMIDPSGNIWTYAYDSFGNITDTTDPLLRTTHITYDAAGRVVASVQNYDNTKPQNDQNLWNITTSYQYDFRGNMIAVTDTYNHTTYYEYDPTGRLVKTIDPAGNETTNIYNDAGQLITSTNVMGRSTHYQYDAAGRLIKTTDPLGSLSQTVYNLDGSVASSIDALGGTTSYVYDNLGRVTSTTQSDGSVTQNTYDAVGNLVTVTDALGGVTHYEYDALSRLIKTIDPLGGFTENFYDNSGRLVQTKDARGNATTYTYGTTGQLLSQTDAQGHATGYEYDALGRRTAVIDAMGNRTEYAYDALDRVVSVTDSLGEITYTSYDALGQMLSQRDANGNETTFDYDILGRLSTQRDALGNVTSYAYDALGNQISITDALGRISTSTYDNGGRLSGATNPLGFSTSVAYDALNRVISSTDELDRISQTEYDSLGRVLKQINNAGGETSHAFDDNGNLLIVTDANGHNSSMTYDALGRVLSQTDANGLTTAFTYDSTGNLLSQTDPAGNQTQFIYDELNRQVQSIDPIGNIIYSYFNANGNLVKKTDAKGVSTQYEYNALGNLTAVIENANPGGVSDGQTNIRTEYTYDGNGNLLTIRDGLGNITATYTYDALNRVITETDALGAVTSYTYDAVGNRATMTDGNGIMVNFAYDALNQLVSVDYPGTIEDIQFAYDAAGQRTTLTDGVGTTTWSFNDLGLPTAITDSFQKTISYSYDAVGNKTSLTYADGKSVKYAYDPGNRLSSVTDWQSLVTQYVYNDLNLVSNVLLPNSVSTAYSYDAKGQVLTIVHASTDQQVASYSYTYDANGNRTRAVEEFLTGLEVIPTVSVLVIDTQGMIQPGISVYAFNGTVYAGFSAITDEQGVAKFILPEGSYRFRADKFGLQYFSSPTNDCTILGCESVEITVPIFTDIKIAVTDSAASPQPGLPVYAYTGTTYTGFTSISDELGMVTFKLPEGSYRFRADKNAEQFFSSSTDDCVTPDCISASITVSQFDNVMITVTNTAGLAQTGIPVFAFDGDTYTSYQAITDADGHAELLLHEGNYRFRADLNGLQYFSAAENHCTVMGCESALLSVPVFGEVTISVTNSANIPQQGLPVYTFEGTTYTNFSGTTDSSGQVTLNLPEGNYRFRTDLNGGQFFSSDENLCAVPVCTSSAISVPQFETVTITVSDTTGLPQVGFPVFTFDGSTYTGYNSTTDANGQVVLLLKEGSYRFRADLNGYQYFSADANHCTVMGCSSATITIPALLPNETPTATITDTPTETPTVTPTETPPVTPTETPTLTLETPVGFDIAGGLVFASFNWNNESGSRMHADQTGTTVTVAVTDSTGAVLGGQTVYVFDGTTYKGISGISDANGQAIFTLTDGNYRFRTDRFNRQYFSGSSNTCSTPTCTSDGIIVPVYGQVAITVKNSLGEVQGGLNVYAFNGATYTNFNAITNSEGIALFNLPEGDYRFRADTHGLQYFSGTSNHCSIPACTTADVTIPLFGDVTLTVSNTAGMPQANLPVYVFNGTTYTGFSARTDASGIASLTLPEGSYRFRTDLNGAQYFSDTANHCDVPVCTSAAITTPVYGSVAVSVLDSDNNPLAGLPVYVFNGTTYTGRSGTTNTSGEVTLNLPEGNYRFRSDLNGQQYFSAGVNHCNVPECTAAQITAAVFGEVTITVTDSAGAVQPDLPIYAFKGTTYTNFNGTTDENGQVTLNLPQGNYRFRADLHGAQYFSAEEDHCAVPECTSVSLVTPLYGQVTITAQSGAGIAQPDLPVYVFNEAAYTGLSGLTGPDGSVTLWIPAGIYRFRADQFDLQFFSAEENHCTVPECTTAAVTTLGMQQVVTEQTIDYTYDPLNRLTGAVYDDGSSFAYTYDAVGNRLTDTVGDVTNRYVYDAANRLASVNGQAYTWDNNGNLLSDGVQTYTYNYANRLTQVVRGSDTYQYQYNGLGDRLQTILNGTATTYSLDLNSGLTQVLADGTNTYTYGYNRIAQVSESQTGYFLGDALGSVRQVVDPQAEILLAQSFSPYGVELSKVGDYETAYSYTGEMTDGTGLVNLRARYYDPGTGRFVSRDTWNGDHNNPISMNKWLYANGNPIIHIDPSGNCIFTGIDTVACLIAIAVGAIGITGVTVAAWDYSVTQGGGVGGANEFNQQCIDWNQVIEAGREGQLGATETIVTSIPLGPLYFFSSMIYGKTPSEVNLNILSQFGLEDEYRKALNNPNYIAGQAGGSTAVGYVSLGSFVKGIPKTQYNPNTYIDPNKLIFVSANDITIIGGNGRLVFAGASGSGSTLLNFFSGNFQYHHPLPKYLLGPENQELYKMSENDHTRYHMLLDNFLPRKMGNNYYNEVMYSQKKQAELYEWLRWFNKDFDKTYGTHTFEALDDVLRAEGWLPHP